MLHTTGNKYKTKDGLIGLLTTFQMGEFSYCMLTTISDSTAPDYKGFNGNRYIDPITVDNPYNIPESEMDRIAGKDWELYTDPVCV